MTDPTLLDEFERRFQEDPDPWRFATSPYERAKRSATVDACGGEAERRVLELGAANGVLAEALLPIARELVAVEAVPAAAQLAQARLAGTAASVVEGMIPSDVPHGPYDLVVASEILYYLDDDAFASTVAALPRWLAPGGKLVAVHWRPVSAERPRTADAVHRVLREHPALVAVADRPTDQYLLTVLERRAQPAGDGAR